MTLVRWDPFHHFTTLQREMNRLFEPFYRTDKSRDHRQDGQGIGLAITARVTELHGGRVTAKNRAEGGLEIALELPLRREPSSG